jgi:hypothetical protein
VTDQRKREGKRGLSKAAIAKGQLPPAQFSQVALLTLAALSLTACAGYRYLPYRYDDLVEGLEPALTTLRVFFALAGLALLVAGWKIYRFVVALPGFLIGAAVGVALGYGGSENLLLAILGLVLGGVVGAGLALLLHDLAVFVVGTVVGVIVVGGLCALVTDSAPPVLLFIIGGLIGGGGLLALSHLWIVLLSSAIGAVMFGAGIGAGVGWMLLFCLLGIAAQYGLAHALGEKIPGPGIGVSKSTTPELRTAPAQPPQPDAGTEPSSPAPPPPLPAAALIGPKGERISVRDGFQIGRGSDCDLRLADRAVSRQHARIRYAGGGWFLQDLDSTGGTFVNGQRVAAVRLGPGDRIQIGPDTFIFHPEELHA